VIGTQGNLSGEFWQGDIAEVLVYDRASSSSELQQDWAYLNQKYFETAAAPEPSSLALLGMAAVTYAGYFGWRRRKLAVA